MIHIYDACYQEIFIINLSRRWIINFQIHDTFPFILIHDFLFFISNLTHRKIINKTFGIYLLQSHIKCNVFNL